MMGILPNIGDLLKPVKDLVSEVVVDKDKRDQVNLELKRIEDQAQARLDSQVSGQIEVNKAEASNASVFVAGWRPAVGWVGAAGLGYSVLIQPLLSWTAAVVFSYRGGFPIIDNELLLYTLGGMLGLGGLRTVEKVKGVAGTGLLESTVVPSTQPATVSIDANAKTGAVSVETTPVSAPKRKKWLL